MSFAAKFDKRAVVPFGAVVCAAAVLVRTVQLFTIVNPATGFYTQEGAVRVLLPVVIAVGLVVAALLVLLGRSRDAGEDRLHPFTAPSAALAAHPPVVLGFVAILTSSGMLADWMLRSRADTGTVHLVSQTLLLVSAVAFLHIGMAVLRKKTLPTWAGYELLLPTAWLLFRAVTSFMEYALITQSSGHLLELFSVLSLLLFLLFAGRLLSGGEKPSTRALMVLTGLAAAMFCLTSSLPPILVRAFGSEELRAGLSGTRVADLAIGLFAFVMLLVPLGANVPPLPVTAPSPEEEDEGMLPKNDGDDKNIF